MVDYEFIDELERERKKVFYLFFLTVGPLTDKYNQDRCFNGQGGFKTENDKNKKK